MELEEDFGVWSIDRSGVIGDFGVRRLRTEPFRGNWVVLKVVIDLGIYRMVYILNKEFSIYSMVALADPATNGPESEHADDQIR